MNHFTQLFNAIDASTKTNDKIAALVDYFKHASDADKVWTIALLIGNKPKRPVKTTDLRIWAAEIADLPLWLIEESYYVVGDLAETLSHVAEYRQNKQNEEEKQMRLQLHEVVVQLKNLQNATIEEKREAIVGFWQSNDKNENFVFNKLITGNFRMGLSKQSVIKALSIYLEKDEKEVAHRLMGKWDPEKETMESLFSESALIDKNYLPYPFYLAYPLEEEPSLALGAIEDCF